MNRPLDYFTIYNLGVRHMAAQVADLIDKTADGISTDAADDLKRRVKESEAEICNA